MNAPEARKVQVKPGGDGLGKGRTIKQGRVSFILDDLIAARSAVPMIVVMENGMVATKPGAAPPEAAGAGRGGPRGNSALEEVVIDDLIPMIDATYRTKYRRYPAGIVDHVVSPQARSATIKLVPR